MWRAITHWIGNCAVAQQCAQRLAADNERARAPARQGWYLRWWWHALLIDLGGFAQPRATGNPQPTTSAPRGRGNLGGGQHAIWAGAASLRICCYNLRCRCPRAELASEIEMLNRHFDLWRSASTSATTATDRRTETLTHCGVPLLFQPAHHPQARFIIAYSALSRHTSTCEWPMHPGAHSTRQHHH